MDSFELNKIIGAVLGTLLFVMGVGFLAEGIYHPIEDRGPGYALPEPAPVVADTGGASAAPEVPLATLLASADATQGQASAKKCQACHDFTDGGPNKTGPNLYDVVDRPIGSHPGFAYSDGMLEHNKNGDVWSYENLNKFITSPKTFTPGTKMTFSGIPDPQERANVLAFLQTLSSSPKPFPAPEAAPAEQPAAGDQPAAPADQTAAPAEQPVAPAAQPETPAAQPAAPEAQPAAPEAQPAAPAEQPAPAVEQPAAPEAPPAAPTEQPATPAEQPAAPAEQPAPPAATPADQPASTTETPATTDTQTNVEGTPTNSAAPAENNTPAVPGSTVTPDAPVTTTTPAVPPAQAPVAPAQ